MHKNDAITIMKRGEKKNQRIIQDLFVAKGGKVSPPNYGFLVPYVCTRAVPGDPTGDQSPTGPSAAHTLAREKLLQRAHKRKIQGKSEHTVPLFGSALLSRSFPRLLS